MMFESKLSEAKSRRREREAVEKAKHVREYVSPPEVYPPLAGGKVF